MIQIAIVVCLFILATGLTADTIKAQAPKPADFYVAANGNDTWTGKLAAPNPDKTDGPFRTLECARDHVRKLKVAGFVTKTGVTVMVRGGIYTLGQTFTLDAHDSGSLDAPMLYRAYPGEKVILSGGPTIQPDVFKRVTDANVLVRLAPTTREHILQVDLRALGIKDLGSFPVKYRGAPAVPELFFNNQRMTLARWPNEGWTTIAKIIAPGSNPRTGDKGTSGGIFEYSGDRPSRWNIDTGVWLHGYWCFDYHDEVIQVKDIDRKTRLITLAAPASYSVKTGNPSARRYYALNLLEELDSPGEFFIDRATELLYFWPPAPLANTPIVLSTLKAPLITMKDANDVALNGFVIDASLGNGIEVIGGNRIRIEVCEVRNTREFGIKISGGTAHKIEACDIHDTGTGGIILSGGDRRILSPANHEAFNNHIWRFSRLKLTGSNALLIQGVGNRVAHNLIHDAPHRAINIDGNDHIIEYNIVHHVCMETDDSGALSKGRNPSCRGNIIRYNFWHHIGSSMGLGTAAIYFDDGDGGDTVFGNIFYRCGYPNKGSFGSVYSHGGHDNLAKNNIFIECERALGSSPWNNERWKNAINDADDTHWQAKLLKEVDITKPPYTTHYPALAGFMDLTSEHLRINRALNNVFVRCAAVSNGNWQVPLKENWSTDDDPGFVNATKGDFRLNTTSEVFSKLPGFKAIAFDKIGLVKNALRPIPWEEAWPHG